MMTNKHVHIRIDLRPCLYSSPSSYYNRAIPQLKRASSVGNISAAPFNLLESVNACFFLIIDFIGIGR